MAHWTFCLAIGTGFIAICTIISCIFLFNSNNRENIRLKSELRPFLVIQLEPSDSDYLKKDTTSHLSFSLVHNKFLIVPFTIKNVGKLPAINIRPMYISPNEANVPFELGENSIAPDEETRELLRPEVDIASEVNIVDKKQFNIILKVIYKGNNEIDTRIYNSILKMVIVKRENNIFDLVDTDFEFGYE